MSYSIPCTLVSALKDDKTAIRISLLPSLEREVEIDVPKNELTNISKGKANLKVNLLPFYQKRENGQVVISINSFTETGIPQQREFYIERKYLIAGTPQT